MKGKLTYETKEMSLDAVKKDITNMTESLKRQYGKSVKVCETKIIGPKDFYKGTISYELLKSNRWYDGILNQLKSIKKKPLFLGTGSSVGGLEKAVKTRNL